MERMKKRLFKLKSNKGFTLVEMIVAVVVFVIAITPIMNGFINSAKINRNSRKVMIETEVCQTIMEGFSDKTYDDVRSSVTKIVGTSLTGNGSFTSIDEGAYNNVMNYRSMMGTAFESKLNDIEINELTWNGMVYATPDLVNDNTITTEMMETFFTEASYASGNEHRLCGYNGDKCTFLFFQNVYLEGYTFDVAVAFLPSAKDDNDKYYTYTVKINLYEVPRLKVGETTNSHFTDTPLMTVVSGIKAN